MRKYICLTLCLLLLASCLAFSALAEPAELTISNADQFLEFAENCRLDSYSKDLTVKLTADIDLTGKDFQGIPIFHGKFDGDGHTVSGVQIGASGSNMGLFRYVAEGASVTNLKISGKIAPGGIAQNVGAIAGSNAGTITDCSVSGEVAGKDNVGGIAGTNIGIIEKCTMSAIVCGDHFVGGIAGKNSGTVTGCKNTGSVNTTEKQNQVGITDVTIGTLTGTESALTVTDIGGIVGNNTGTVELCENSANVGYQYMGYNIGGIAGSSSGFITGCKNLGEVRGRKDVGGIVGQLEPGITLLFDKDTLQILAEQMDVLSQLTQTAKEHAATASAAINEQIDILDAEIEKAQIAIDKITPESLETAKPSVLWAALQELMDSLSNISNTINTLTDLIREHSTILSEDMDAISSQIEVIEGTLKNSDENLNGTLVDVSDRDTEEDTTGKVAGCTNHGAVRGDRNVGGIAGTVNLENDLDPESDITVQGEESFNQSCEARAVIRSCVSTASVTSKKQNTGGIVGCMYLGLVRDCSVTGTITANGKYTGGIAGNSLAGFIRSCYVKAPISGDYCVGGIAGSAVTVTDCLVLTQITGTEALGAVLGMAEELNHITGNCYMLPDSDIGAIDGISYEGHALPLKAEAFMALEYLPELFLNTTVTFRFPDNTEKTVTVTPGATLTPEQIPQLPEKDGTAGVWMDQNGNVPGVVLFDTTFEANYTALPNTLESNLAGVNGRPVMLAQGYFPAGATLTLEKKSESGFVGCWNFSVTPGSTLTALRLQIPEGYKAKHLQVQLQNSKGAWRTVSFTESGSYLVFSANADDVSVRLVEAPADYTLWFIIAGGSVVLIVTVVVLVVVRCKKKKKAEPAPEVTAEI